MIRVNRLNQEPFLVNCDLIEYVEETPHTVIYMASGRKFVVVESSEEIKNLVIEYKRKVFSSGYLVNMENVHTDMNEED